MSQVGGLSLKGWLVVLANAALIALLCWSGYMVGDKDQKAFALTLLFAATGAILGWLLGFLASPYTTEESKRFSDLARVAWAFVGGFVLSKLDPLLTRLTTGEALLVSPLVGPHAPS